MFYSLVETPIGLLQISGKEGGITSVQFVGTKGKSTPPQDTDTVLPQVFEDARIQLMEYFSGERTDFDLAIFPGGTSLQQQVWDAVSDVEYGKTSTFSTIAHQLRKPKSVMVIGQIIHDNPLQIIIPDHRIFTEDRMITGHEDDIFRKDWLVRHEQRINGESLF